MKNRKDNRIRSRNDGTNHRKRQGKDGIKSNNSNSLTDNFPLNAVVADRNGNIFELEDYGAAAMSGSTPVLLTKGESISTPYGSELMMLPNTRPLVFNFDRGQFEVLHENPYAPGEEIFPVAVFNSPGYVNRFFCAYEHIQSDYLLPLFSYGACGWDGSTVSRRASGGPSGAGSACSEGSVPDVTEGFCSAAILVDSEPRQDLRLMPHEGIVAGVDKMRLKYSANRLMRHLERCALEYGCPAAKNFFLGRFEAPLPTSRACNANCLGCISLQKTDNLMACQDRISFIPEPYEIAEVAIEHLSKVSDGVVSFGQGCEGDPLTAFNVIEPALRSVRSQSSTGTINMNTNAGITERLAKLFDAGLDSVRVSMNSIREECYSHYFRPVSYSYNDVINSISAATDREKFVSINYLNCPGVTDSEREFDALVKFMKRFPVNMIQWRNMNYDPLSYLERMEAAGGKSNPLGMEFIIRELEKEFPKLIHGYFNPPKERFLR